MSEPFSVPERGWFASAGPHYDVVISSRMRLSRNLTGFRFPERMNGAERRAVEQAVAAAVSEQGTFRPLCLAELDAVTRRMLVERNLITPALAESAEGTVFIAAEESAVVAVNDRDHLRISAMRPGLDLAEVEERCYGVEHLLDRELRFAAALEWGYLTADLADLGGGMQISALLHLPALEAGGELRRVVRELGGPELRLRAFPLANAESLGAVYLLSNRNAIGRDEPQTREKVEDCAVSLVHYERSERERLMLTRRGELCDGVAQALEIVSQSRQLPDTEMFQVLSWLRLGVAMGLYDRVRLEPVTALFFVGQRAHVMHRVGLDEDGDNALVNEQRPQIIRELLGIGR